MAFQEETRVPPQFLPLSILRAVWKRWLWLLMVWGLVSAAAFVIVMRIPAVYKAQSLVLIEGQRIPERYVPATVNDEVSNRLSMLTQQIKSYNALLKTIDKLQLYREERKTMTEEEVINQMRKDIDVDVVAGWSRQTFPAFTISFQGSDPVKVAAVAASLTSEFQDQNIKMRKDQTRGTSQFLESQLKDARQDLETQEGKMSTFRQQYSGELPTQSTALMGRLNRLELQLKGVQDSVRNGEEQKILLENSLSSAQNTLTSIRELASQVATAKTPNAMPNAPRPPTDLEKARAQLDRLRLSYSESHPDVARTKVLIERLEAAEAQRVAAEPPPAVEGSAAEAAPVALSASLTTNLREHEDRVRAVQVQQKILVDEMARLEQDRARILAEMGDVQRRVEKLPLVEQEFAKVVRDYDMSRNNYQRLLNQKMEADVAGKMETLEKAERFSVLDMPRIPTKPIKPNREALIGMGCLGGLGLGMLVAFAMELRRGVLLGEWELPEGVTVLGRIPPVKLSIAKSQMRLEPKVKKRSRWRNARITLRLRSPKKQLVLAPTIVLCLLGALVATSIFTGWNPF